MILLKKLKQEGFDFNKLPDDIRRSANIVLADSTESDGEGSQKIQMLDLVTYKCIRKLYRKEVEDTIADIAFKNMPGNDGFNTRGSNDTFAEGGVTTETDQLWLFRKRDKQDVFGHNRTVYDVLFDEIRVGYIYPAKFFDSRAIYGVKKFGIAKNEMAFNFYGDTKYFDKIEEAKDFIKQNWALYASGGPTETRYQIKNNEGAYYSRLGGSEHFNDVPDFGLLYDEEEAEDVKDWLQKRGYTDLAIVPYMPQQEYAYASGGSIEKPRPGTFLYGKRFGVPENYSTELLQILNEKGFSIAKLKGQSVDLFKDGHRFYVNDNGGELNLGDIESGEHISNVPYSITTGIRKPSVLAGDIQAAFENYYNEPHHSDFKVVGTDVIKFKDKPTGQKILNEAPPLYVSYSVSWIGPGYTKALIGQDLPAGWYATKSTGKLPHAALTLDTLLHYQRKKSGVNIISEEIITPTQTDEDLNDIDETYSPTKGKILMNLFNRYYESHLKEKFGITGRSFDGLTAHLTFKNGSGNIDFSRNAQINSYSPNMREKLKELSEFMLSLQGTSHDQALKLLAGTQPKPQPLPSSYPNAYELNKAIEKLLDSKPNDADFTADEKSFLKYYSGYGGLEKHGATGKGLLYEYYTPSLIAEKMWGLAYKYGFNGGSVLEPSAGIGEFIKYAPEQHLVVAHEINKYSARICKILYPLATVSTQYFEEIFIKNNDSIRGKTSLLKKYKLVIGNPPYGEFGGKWAGMGEKSYTRAGNYIDYFIFRGLDLLDPGGLLIFIVGAEVASGGTPFLAQQMNKCKEEIQEKSDLLDAYRLPNGVFERTDVLTDIIVLRKK